MPGTSLKLLNAFYFFAITLGTSPMPTSRVHCHLAQGVFDGCLEGSVLSSSDVRVTTGCGW